MVKAVFYSCISDKSVVILSQNLREGQLTDFKGRNELTID